MRWLVPWLPMLAVLISIPWIWAMYDILRRPSDEWRRARHNRWVWLLLVFWLPVFVLLPYFVWMRPRLEPAAQPHGP